MRKVQLAVVQRLAHVRDELDLVRVRVRVRVRARVRVRVRPSAPLSPHPVRVRVKSGLLSSTQHGIVGMM